MLAMRDELQWPGLLLRREVPDELLARRRGLELPARMLPGLTTRRPMEAQLEQVRPLHTIEGIGVMDPNPLADNFREAPLTDNATADRIEDLRHRERPALAMQRLIEMTIREPNGTTLRRTVGGRLRRD